MTHDVLEICRVDAVANHLAAAGVPANIRGKLGMLILVDIVMLLYTPAEVVLPVKGNLGLLFLVQENETADSVNDRLFCQHLPAIDNRLEAFSIPLRHKIEALTARSLRTLDIIDASRRALQLLVDMDGASIEINFVSGHADKLRNA